jgi:hypothetical protein
MTMTRADRPAGRTPVERASRGDHVGGRCRVACSRSSRFRDDLLYWNPVRARPRTSPSSSSTRSPAPAVMGPLDQPDRRKHPLHPQSTGHFRRCNSRALLTRMTERPPIGRSVRNEFTAVVRLSLAQPDGTRMVERPQSARPRQSAARGHQRSRVDADHREPRTLDANDTPP